MSDETRNSGEPTAADYEAAASAWQQEAEADTAGTSEQQGDEQRQHEDSGGNTEAAKYRRRLRGTEAELGAIKEKLAAMQHAQIDTHAESFGIKPAALWASGAQLDDLLAADGIPDVEKIKTAVQAARDTLGIQTTQPIKGLRSGASSPQPRVDPWHKAFAPRER